MRALPLLLVLALGCTPVTEESASDLAVSKAQFWGGWSGGGGSSGGASTSAANTWTAKQTVNVADGSDAISLDLGDRLNIADGTGFYLYSDGSFVLSNGAFRASELSVNGAAWVAAATGKMSMTAGNSTGAPGNATLNTPTGRSAFAAAVSAVTITNNLVSATSIVLPVLQTVDGTLTQILTCVPASGSFTCTGNAAATGTTNFGWMVIN